MNRVCSLPLLALAGVLAVTPAAADPASTAPGPPPAERYPQPLVGIGDHYPDELGWWVPDYFKLQTGGFLGALHASLGYSLFEDVVAIGGGYGYAPMSDGIGPYHALTGTITLRPVRINPAHRLTIVPLYLGGGVLGALGDNLFFEQPPEYPSGYYRPSALHAVAFLGLEVALRDDQALLERHGLFVEFVTVNQYLDALIENRSRRFLDAFSTSLGYRAML